MPPADDLARDFNPDAEGQTEDETETDVVAGDDEAEVRLAELIRTGRASRLEVRPRDPDAGPSQAHADRTTVRDFPNPAPIAPVDDLVAIVRELARSLRLLGAPWDLQAANSFRDTLEDYEVLGLLRQANDRLERLQKDREALNANL